MSDNEIVQHSQGGQLATQPIQHDPFLAMVERAWDRPEVLDKLVAVRNAELERRAKNAFWRDFALMQPSLPSIERNGSIVIRKKDARTGERDGDIQQASKYALWADILEACSPHMKEHGFGITFRQKFEQDGRITVTGILSHRDGHMEENSITLKHDATGSKNETQAIGSTLSYGMRYMGTMLLGVASKQGDDDGAAAGAQKTISDEELARLQMLVSNAGADEERFCQYLKIQTLADLPADRLNYAIEALKQKQKAQ